MPTPEDMATGVAETTLTPAEMFLADLNTSDVSEPIVESEASPADVPSNIIMEEGSAEEPAPETASEPVGNPDQFSEPAPAGVTRDDLNAVKDDILAKVLEMARQSNEAPAPAETAETPAPAQEEEISDDKINEDFYSNPAATIRELANKIAEKNVKERLAGLQEELKPLLEQSKAAQEKNEVKGILGDFLDKNGDAKDYFQDIAQYVKENNLPINNPQTYMDAYRESKLRRQGDRIAELEAQAQAGSRSLEDYLNDEGSLSQILANDNVKARVIEDYLKNLQNGARPATIASGSSTIPVGQPAVNAGNMNDAGRMLLDDLNK